MSGAAWSLAPRGPAGRAAPSSALETVEVALRQLRVLAGTLLFLYYVLRPEQGDASPPPLVTAVVVALTVAGVNLLSLLSARLGRSKAGVLLGAAELAADSVLVFCVVAVLRVGREDLVWVALVVPVLEAALRYRLRGAVLTWACLALAYAAVHLAGGAGSGPEADMRFLADLQTAVHRLGVVLLVATPAGYLSEQLLFDIAAQRRASGEATQRSGLLQRVAEAGQRVTRLDEPALDTVLGCVIGLGFPAAEVCQRNPDGRWEVTTRSGDGPPLPGPEELPAAMSAAARRGGAAADGSSGTTARERAALAAAGYAAVVHVALPRADGMVTVLRAGVTAGATVTPAQLECLELLAGQAGTALHNNLLVGELRELQARLEHQAFHDSLTSLANRARFLRGLEEAVSAPADPGAGTAVLFLDLDRFKPVNDSFGHDVGNELLVAVAERLRGCARDGDLVARLGGDEFAVLMHPVADSREPQALAERVCKALSRPFAPSGNEVVVSTSVGIAVLDGARLPAAELLRRADVAMYAAKQRGRARWQQYEPALDEAAHGRMGLEADLRHALARGQLALAYQPIVTTVGREVVGFEALLRWHHPVRGSVRPEDFLPLAEDSGVIVDLGRWVLRQAVAQVRRLQDAGHRGVHVAVNVSPRQLQHLRFFADLDELLEESGIDPRGLLLEITERIVVLDDCEELLLRLRERGVRLALDDFGQGQTSLRYLRRFPLDVLKVDKDIVHGGVEDARDAIVLRSIVTLARELGLAVVAEGVETERQLALLQSLACELVQGFHLGPPVAADGTDALLPGPSGPADVVVARGHAETRR